MTAATKPTPTLPAPTTEAAVKKRVLMVAASQIGVREGQDSSGYNNDNPYGLWYGYNGVSWCAQFVSWCAGRAGVLGVAIPKHQYTPAGWNWFVARNEDVTSPQAGDVMYVYGPVAGEKNPRVHHVGFVEKVLSGGRIQTIEGNTNTSGSSQGNGVYRLVRTVSSRLKFARPNYAAAVMAPVPPAKGGTPAKPAPSQETDMALTDDDVQRIAKAVWNFKVAADHTTGDSLERSRSAAMRLGDSGDINQQLDRIEDDTNKPAGA